MDHHLLRTLAAVPPGQRVLLLSSGANPHAKALEALGFDVIHLDPAATQTLDLQDDMFDWIVGLGWSSERITPATLRVVLSEALRLMKPGGWLYLAISASLVQVSSQEPPRGALTRQCVQAGWQLAEPPVEEEGGIVRGIYRKVTDSTSL